MIDSHRRNRVLILGIGNVLMGDEGVGVHLAQYLSEKKLPAGTEVLDGGTGSFQLLEPISRCDHLILVDATVDGRPAGTVRRLEPRYSSDYPPSLTAHDIGLKDLLDTMYLMDHPPQTVLFAVSIEPLQELGLDLSKPVKELLPDLAERTLHEAKAYLSKSRSDSV